jgi:hypothetical protein
VDTVIDVLLEHGEVLGSWFILLEASEQANELFIFVEKFMDRAWSCAWSPNYSVLVVKLEASKRASEITILFILS